MCRAMRNVLKVIFWGPKGCELKFAQIKAYSWMKLSSEVVKSWCVEEGRNFKILRQKFAVEPWSFVTFYCPSMILWICRRLKLNFPPNKLRWKCYLQLFSLHHEIFYIKMSPTTADLNSISFIIFVILPKVENSPKKQ